MTYSISKFLYIAIKMLVLVCLYSQTILRQFYLVHPNTYILFPHFLALILHSLLCHYHTLSKHFGYTLNSEQFILNAYNTI